MKRQTNHTSSLSGEKHGSCTCGRATSNHVINHKTICALYRSKSATSATNFELLTPLPLTPESPKEKKKKVAEDSDTDDNLSFSSSESESERDEGESEEFDAEDTPVDEKETQIQEPKTVIKQQAARVAITHKNNKENEKPQNTKATTTSKSTKLSLSVSKQPAKEPREPEKPQRLKISDTEKDEESIILEFLRSIGLERLYPRFQEEEIDLVDLPLLTERELEEVFQIKLGPRRRILKAIEMLDIPPLFLPEIKERIQKQLRSSSHKL